MAEESRYLMILSERIAAAYVDRVHPSASLLAGSAAIGDSDAYPDVDLIVYHVQLPSDEELASARKTAGVEEILFVGGDRGMGRYQETYRVQGIECQIGHVTTDVWERDLAHVLEDFDAMSPIQKAIDGLLQGRPLFGTELIGRWQERARAYPDGLTRAMVLAHLRFVPIWRFQDRLRARDALSWYYQILVETSHNLLAVLAGINRLYYSPVEFKRMHAFVSRMSIAPDQLAERLDALFGTDPALAVADLERLVAETVALVQAQLPEVDVTDVHKWLEIRERPRTLAQAR
jgi:hypothetical protein